MTNLSKTRWLKATTVSLLSLTMSVVRFLGRVQLGSSALGSHMDVMSWWLKLGQWGVPVEVPAGGVWAALSLLVLTGLLHVVSPCGLVWASSNHGGLRAVKVLPWQLWSSVSLFHERGRNSLTSSDLALGLMQHHVCNMLLVISNSQACSDPKRGQANPTSHEKTTVN